MTEASPASSLSFLISFLLVGGHRSPGLLPVRFQIFHTSSVSLPRDTGAQSSSSREGWGLRSIPLLHSLVALSLERKDSLHGRQDREILRPLRGCQNHRQHLSNIYYVASPCLCFLHMHKRLTVAKWSRYNTGERATFSLSLFCALLTWCSRGVVMSWSICVMR